MLTHIVLFKLKDRSQQEEVKNVFMGMEGKIPQLKYLEVGLDVLNSERSYDVALITKFDSMETMQEYQVHPVHVKVAEFLASVRESAVAIDFIS